jgi:hypothetical protein
MMELARFQRVIERKRDWQFLHLCKENLCVAPVAA